MIEQSIYEIEQLFDKMHGVNASNWQHEEVRKFRARVSKEVNDDLDFCFEVLAGKHKLGFTMYPVDEPNIRNFMYDSIQEFVEAIKLVTAQDKTQSTIYYICSRIPLDYQRFLVTLLNREYKLGYTNRNNMVTDKHCMLAKSYPQGVTTTKQYYIQEKLNGNRCIAYYDFELDQWQFISRSQKPC